MPPDANPTPTPTPTPTPSEAGDATETPAPTAPPADEYEAALQEAQDAMMDRQAALQAADWAAYGEADARLTAAVERLIELGDQ